MSLLALLPVVGNILDKIIPDPAQKAEAQLKMLEMAQKGEMAVLDADLKIALGQIETNKIEAASAGLYKGGWRPGAGWICVAGLGYTFLLRPLLPWFATLAGFDVPPLPPIDTMELIALLGGMLGLGGFRTYERVKGKA